MYHHTVQISEHIARSNPQRRKSDSTQSAIADVVQFRIVPHRVRFAIDLDCESAFKTNEVDDISGAGELSAKPKSVRSLPQLLPQRNFRQSQRAAKFARKPYVCIRRANCAVVDTPLDPSTMLRMVPLPVPGRISIPRHPFTVQEQTANVKPLILPGTGRGTIHRRVNGGGVGARELLN
jgi:hypothetical protein